MKQGYLTAIIAFCILAVGAIGGAAILSAADQAAPAVTQALVGQPAPDFTGTDSNGAEQKLSSYAGKVVVLEWTNPECPYVKKHYGSRNMQDLQKAATDDGVIWLRVNSGAPGKQGHQTPGDINALASSNGTAATATLIDETGSIGKLYGAKTTPHMFVIDTTGTLVYAGAIDDNDSSDAADIATSKNYVKAVLDDIKTGRAISISDSKPYGCAVKYKD